MTSSCTQNLCRIVLHRNKHVFPCSVIVPKSGKGLNAECTLDLSDPVSLRFSFQKFFRQYSHVLNSGTPVRFVFVGRAKKTGNWSPTAGNEITRQATAIVDAENKQLLNMGSCGRGTGQPRRTSQRHSTISSTPSLAVHKHPRLAIPRLWQMWCERKYKTSQHKNTLVSNLQVHSYNSNVSTASLRQRSEAAHSHPKLGAFLSATPELQSGRSLRAVAFAGGRWSSEMVMTLIWHSATVVLFLDP